MADEIITKQKLINASLDATSLEEFISGGDIETVVTRLNIEYPTLANAIRQIYEKGGKFYPTLADANADIANIRTDVYVITGDNGAYYKATSGATSLTKSPYDPLMQANNYTDNKIDLIPIDQININDYSVVFQDKNGLAAVGLLIDLNGKPSIYMLNSIFDGIKDRIDDQVILAMSNTGISIQNTPDGSFFIVDNIGKRSWLGADNKGLPDSYTAKCIVDALSMYGYSLVPTTVKSTYQSAEIKAVSGPDIDGVGDSMTAGAGGNGTTYITVLNQLISAHGSTAIARNSGVGGETSPTITARMGGYPFQVRVTGGVIPATKTPVIITLDDINGQPTRPLLQGVNSLIGSLAGVAGNITLHKENGSTWDNANYYTFTRLTEGSDVAVDRPEPFTTDYAKLRLGDIKIIWIGQNGPSTDRAIQDAKAIIQSMNTLDKRYIVLSKPTATPEDDAKFFAEFGSRFIAVKKYMVEFGIYDAGITPTEQDLIDIANYIIPLPLCASASDRLHWSAAGYTVLAHLIFKKLKELGWI